MGRGRGGFEAGVLWGLYLQDNRFPMVTSHFSNEAMVDIPWISHERMADTNGMHFETNVKLPWIPHVLSEKLPLPKRRGCLYG